MITVAETLLAIKRESMIIIALMVLMAAGVVVAFGAFVMLGRERGRRLTFLGWEEEPED